MSRAVSSLFVGLASIAVGALSITGLAQANPGLPFYGYGSIVANPGYPVVGENTHITVTVGNTGPVPATAVQVKVSFNDWGMTFQGWQEIGTATIPSIPAGGTATAEFDHVFTTRAHTCLEALIVSADENADPNDDRGQINLEVVNAGETFSYGVPIANNGDQPLDLLVCGRARGDGGVPPGTPDKPCADPLEVHLEPGEVAFIPVVIDLEQVPVGGVVEYLVEAFNPAAGTREHVLLRVVKTTAFAEKERVTQQMETVAAGLPRGATANQFKTAVAQLQKALDPALWPDENHVRRNGGAQVFAHEGFFDRKAKELLPLLPADAKVAVEGALRQLVDCDRILAQTAIADAGGHAAAQTLFDEADRLRLAGDGDAIDRYKHAWLTATR